MNGGGVGLGAVVILVAAVAYLLLAGGDSGDDGGRPLGTTSTAMNGSEGRPQAEAETAMVTEVVDGDTVRATVNGELENVRYIGIDTPEVDPNIGVECFGDQASQRNRELVGGERVRLVPGAEERDQYGRLLAYVYVGDAFVNAKMVEGGFARTLEFPPNTEHAALLNRLEQEAANAGRGLWRACL